MVTKADVTTLIDVDEDPAVSIYMPVHATFPDRNKNVIRLRNLMRQAEDDLRARGADPAAVLARARELLEPTPPVEGVGVQGLAIFITADDVRTFSLSGRPAEFIRVGKGFHIAPLVPSVEHSQYYAITLDQNSPTLFRGNRFSFERVAEGVAEQSLDAIRGVTQIPARTGFHPSGPAGRGGQAGRPDAMHHAQGEAPEDYEQIELDQYTRGIAHAVEKRLKGEETPLIPVGQPNLLGMFRKHCRYSGLNEEAVAKSPAHLDEAEIHRLTLEVASEALLRPAREAASRAVAAHNRGDETVAIKPRQILEAAGMGRVDTLLLARAPNGAGLWVPEDEPGAPGEGAELRERLVRAAVAQGGGVMTVDAAELPDDASVAALYRF